MIRSTLVRREEDDDTGISDGGWRPLEVGVGPQEVGVGGLEGIEGELAEGRGGIERDQFTPAEGVEFLPGCDVLEWGNVQGVVDGWVSHSTPPISSTTHDI